jgi:hypothetical protein
MRPLVTSLDQLYNQASKMENFELDFLCLKFDSNILYFVLRLNIVSHHYSFPAQLAVQVICYWNLLQAACLDATLRKKVAQWALASNGHFPIRNTVTGVGDGARMFARWGDLVQDPSGPLQVTAPNSNGHQSNLKTQLPMRQDLEPTAKTPWPFWEIINSASRCFRDCEIEHLLDRSMAFSNIIIVSSSFWTIDNRMQCALVLLHSSHIAHRPLIQ